ncbi:MAG: Hsp20/alpha crystallin family protein [Candidatus Bathyarchaeia archaeon]
MSKKKTKKETKPSEKEVVVTTPEVSVDHDDKGYYIEVELPGVKKEAVSLTVGAQSFCVEASREDVVFMGCFTLAHPVDEGKAKAKFESGLLKVEVPLKAPLKGKRIEIQ